MHPFIFSYPTLAVSLIYCLWNFYFRSQWQERTFRERVAYMLWVMANMA